MSNTEFIIDLNQLLFFFDEKNEARAHANAIKTMAGEELGFALLLQYFRQNGVDARRETVPCTTGKYRGHRLDGWVKVSREKSDLYYQVEVKTWSQHSIGGRPLPVAATETQLREFKKERWRRYWANGTFKDKELIKVLTPMKPPITPGIVEPLACIWDAVHPEGSDAPFFSVPLLNGPFRIVHVFSMSAFVRGLTGRTLKLQMPCLQDRLDWLQRIFRTESDTLKIGAACR
jgi:hypothetical protein